jgi:uncharacterized membrane protein YgcG
MSSFKLLLSVLLLTVAASANLNCNLPISDEANVLGQSATLLQAVSQLSAKGVDIHVVSVPTMGTVNLDMLEKAIETGCRSWQAPNGGRKSTLLVLMVAPNDHKMGVYYGSAWSKALDQHWNRIKQDYMFPRFKTGDFAGGMAAAAQQFAARISASEDEAQHPAQTTVVNEAPKPEDLSGLWRVLEWLFGILFAGMIVAFIYSLLSRRAQKKEEIESARADAITKRNQAAGMINELRIKDNLSPQKQQEFDSVYATYTELSERMKSDPDERGLSLIEYQSIARQYGWIVDKLEEIKSPAKILDPGSRYKPKVRVVTPTPTPQPAATPAQPSGPASSNVNFEPIIIGNEFGGSEPRREPGPVRTPEPEPASSSSSWDFGGGGGSSDYSSDSSSSSDFGGGSSDFSSGGDSGGGGGSDSF